MIGGPYHVNFRGQAKFLALIFCRKETETFFMNDIYRYNYGSRLNMQVFMVQIHLYESIAKDIRKTPPQKITLSSRPKL